MCSSGARRYLIFFTIGGTPFYEKDDILPILCHGEDTVGCLSIFIGGGDVGGYLLPVSFADAFTGVLHSFIMTGFKIELQHFGGSAFQDIFNGPVQI